MLPIGSVTSAYLSQTKARSKIKQVKNSWQKIEGGGKL